MARETITVAEYKALVKAKKPSKYRNKRTMVDGLTFDSAAEARHWTVLKYREKAGEITELRRQVPFSFDWNGVHICKFVADFTFKENGAFTVQDVKGKLTRDYIIKRKLLKAFYGYDIVEIKA